MVEAPEELISEVLNAAFAVHTELGPGLYETIYKKAMAIELGRRGINARVEVEVPVSYKGEDLALALRLISMSKAALLSN